MKTIVSINQLCICRAVLTWYLERRREVDNVSPNTNLNVSKELWTKPTRHETSDLFDHASRDRPRSLHTNTSVEFKSLGQASGEAGISKLVEVEHFLGRQTSDCT